MVDELVHVLPGKHRRLAQPGNVEHQLDERSPTASLTHPARTQVRVKLYPPPGRRSAGALPPSSNTMRLVDPLELQIPHPVAQPLATLLELGDRPLVRAGNVGAISGLVAVTRCGVHYLEHVLGVMRPVGG